MIEYMKAIKDVLFEAWKIEEYTKILDIQWQLSISQNENLELKNQIRELKILLDKSKKMVFKNNAYYNWEDWPFCSRCWDKNKDSIRIIPRTKDWNYAYCPECKNYVNYTWLKDKSHKIVTTKF